MPSLSIVLPVLNNHSGVAKALNSILRQGRREVELVVIDGGSTDGTIDVIKSYQKHISYWESGLDCGLSDAFNRGIQNAAGDVIGILNSDDELELGAIDHLFDAIEHNPMADVYYGSLRYYDCNRNYSYIRAPNINQMKRRMSLFHPSMFVKKACYQCVGGYDNTYTHAMDSEWCHRAIVCGARFAKINAVLATMSLGGISDEGYRVSLAQYRDSSIKHGIASPFVANYYYRLHLLRKILMRFPLMHDVKKLRDRIMSVRT